MKLEPNEAEYLRTIVRSQIMTPRARTKLLDLIDAAAGELLVRHHDSGQRFPVAQHGYVAPLNYTGPVAEARTLTPEEKADRDRGYSGPMPDREKLKGLQVWADPPSDDNDR